MKVMLVLVVALLAIFAILYGQSAKQTDGPAVTPTPTVQPTGVTEPPMATGTPGVTQPTGTATPQPTAAPTATAAPTPTPTAASTVTPVPMMTAEEAVEQVKKVVDTAKYRMELLNDHLDIDGTAYFQFCILENGVTLEPFLLVNKKDGTIHCYSTSGEVSDFVKFPLDPVSRPDAGESRNLSVEEAYGVLCGYSKERLGLAKPVAEYDAEYDSELTLVKGVNCYRINLTEVSGGKVRNRGEFYVSVDGTACYTIDNDLNDFVLIQK